MLALLLLGFPFVFVVRVYKLNVLCVATDSPSDAELLAHLRNDGVGGNTTLIVFITSHVDVAINPPVFSPAVFHNPELWGDMATRVSCWVWADLRIVGAALVGFASCFEQGTLRAAAGSGGGAGMSCVADDVGKIDCMVAAFFAGLVLAY